MDNNKDFTEVAEIPRGADLPETGLMQTRSPYSTAVQVVKPRRLEAVAERCLTEAAIAGDDFYYSWTQGGQVTEGLTVGAALAIARNMGNNAVDVEVRETPQAWYFTGAYIDLETGFNIRRTFRQNKQSPRTKTGKEIYSGDRGQDILFQIGQSKCLRNVVLNAVPNWLGRQVFEKAKENVIAKIEKMGVPKVVGILTQKMENLGIPMDRVVSVFGKAEVWDVEKLVRIMGGVRSIEDGRERLDDVFPPIGGQAPVNPVAEAAKEALQKQIDAKNGKESKPDPDPPPPAASAPAPAAPEETPGDAQEPSPEQELVDKRAKLTEDLLVEITQATNPKMLATVAVKIVKAKGEGEVDEKQGSDLMKAHSAKVHDLAPKKENGK